MDGTKYDVKDIDYYAKEHAIEFMQTEEVMINISKGLMTGKQMNITEMNEEESFDIYLGFGDSKEIHLDPFNKDVKNISGWIKVIKGKAGNKDKYTVSFDLKTDKHIAKGMFGTSTEIG